MVQRSKKYREAAEKIDRNNLYTANEAIALLKSMPEYKFDQTVEAVLRLNVDPRKADQLVRGSVNLPNGTGKLSRLAPTSSVMTTSCRRSPTVSLTSIPSSPPRT